MTDVTVVTCSAYMNPDPHSEYVGNIFLEYHILKEALEQQGFSVGRISWDDPNFDWSGTKIALIRTVWDYFERFKEFNKWMTETARLCKLINPLALQQWNADKNYLRDLQQKGVRIVPTEFIPKASFLELQTICAHNCWHDIVIKPAISAAAFHTYKIPGSEVKNKELLFGSLLEERDMLVQPFQESIVTKGEASLMIFNGLFTHAILKKAKQGDFRVQDDFGGTVHPYVPSKDEISFAENAMKQCPVDPVYGRVDIIWDEEGVCYLSEMEFLDPEIWLRECPGAAHELARAVARHLP